ncbi:MAG: diaminopimelate epimerase [Candidatus Omnitrophota bacterium]
MVASGNDFVIAEGENLGKLAHNICDRKYGIGADGLLVIEKSKIADIKMRIFNADGSEAEMCGNGARCAALWVNKPQVKIETLAGIIESKIHGKNVKIKLTDPVDFKLNIPLLINERKLSVNFVNTGVPHVVIFVEGVDKINVFEIGRLIRYHKAFGPRGTNINFVEVVDDKNIIARTYERGVEGETLACGTGSAASALVASLVHNLNKKEINVKVRSGEILKIYFKSENSSFKDVWLEGKVKIVYKGEYNV